MEERNFTSYGSKSPVVLAFEKSVANSEPKFTLEIMYLLSGSINKDVSLVYNLELFWPANSFQNVYSQYKVSKAISHLIFMTVIIYKNIFIYIVTSWLPV